ncbi:hypothetical protein C2G38_2056192 [Gigaspora rosea]|uniref:Uncharacterized protein n=1 Tax=Gigaspora rosea TaxID=44941 RepID=A0A397WC92_9GLOM|nr:hypothetical protein C2G38_2096900 [Gigaspora rosea]RIB29436.1 hypothetical protein C2G38_2056668 [Gigaspora rosea]RIB29656.1 hypothetical protein C2G38_2056192 [Gigaspora rosea]
MSVIQISITPSTVVSTILSTVISISTSLITQTSTPTSTPTITQTPQYFQDSNVIETLAILGTLIITSAIAIIYKAKQLKNKNNEFKIQKQQADDARIAEQVRQIRTEL